jgi:hypothetical protein
MRSRVLKYYAMGLLAIIISFNTAQIWHNGWAHTNECNTSDNAQHITEDADCLLCHLYFSATNTEVQVLSILISSTLFLIATWHPKLITSSTILGQFLRGPPALMA